MKRLLAFPLLFLSGVVLSAPISYVQISTYATQTGGFKTSSGTVTGQLIVGTSIRWPDGTVQISSPLAGAGVALADSPTWTGIHNWTNTQYSTFTRLNITNPKLNAVPYSFPSGVGAGGYFSVDTSSNVTFIAGTGGVSWGAITGVLSAQTDLNTILNTMGVSTQTLAVSTGAIAVSTGLINGQTYTLGVSTYALAQSTGNIATSTGTLSASTQTLRTDVNGKMASFSWPTCSGTDKLTAAGTTPTCATDQTAAGGGDNLGNHVATMTLTANYGIVASSIAVSSMTVSTLTVTSSFALNNISNLNMNSSVGITNALGIQTSTLSVSGAGGASITYGVTAGSVTADLFISSPSASGVATGIKLILRSSDTVSFGTVGRIASDGKVKIATATAIASASGIVMCADSTCTAGSNANWLLIGEVTTTTTTWTIGGLMYLSTTGTSNGTLTQTAPSGANNVIQILGVAIDSNRILFKPELVQVEHT